MLRSKLFLGALLCLCLFAGSCFAVDGVARLGMNLAGPADWNTELPFVDVFRMSRPWISQQKEKAWGKGPQLLLDEYGWVRRLEKDCFAETPLCTIDGGHYLRARTRFFMTEAAESTLHMQPRWRRANRGES